MPGTIESPGHSVKRKRVTLTNRPSKCAKSESSDEEDDSQAQLLEMGEDIVAYKKYDKIETLLNILRVNGEVDEAKSTLAAVSLCRVFATLIEIGDLSNKPGKEEELKRRYSDYKSLLFGRLREQETSSTTLSICMKLLKVEGKNLLQGQAHSFPADFLTKIIGALLETDNSPREDFRTKYVEKHDDIRFYTLKAIEDILGKLPLTEGFLFDNALEILQQGRPVPESREKLEMFYIPKPKTPKHDLYSLTRHKAQAQRAWLALMSLNVDKSQRKQLLNIMAKSIAPWFTKPELLMDFLTDSYNAGGSTSLLALSGVFYLIQERNLDYPSFYPKLYSLLDSHLLHSKHRSRFFRLLDTFLASTHLPAVLVASFLKRLSRLTLNAPPSAVVAVVPWIYNILKRHPTCTFMIHRETRDADAKEKLKKEGMEDPFLMDEEDPMETNAIESSLWEIVTLQSHFHPNVATLANIISEQFTKQSYNIEDFLDHSNESMLKAELTREVTKVPIIEPEIPKKIFMEHDIASGLDNSLLVGIFDFS